MKIETVRRTVLVLGRQPAVDLGAHFAAARAVASDVLIVAVGFPLSPDQQRVVNDAVALAVESGVWMEARIAYRPRELAEYVHRDDRVQVFADGREERAIGRALRKVGLTPTSRGPAAR